MAHFCCIFHALSFEFKLFFDRSLPLSYPLFVFNDLLTMLMHICQSN